MSILAALGGGTSVALAIALVVYVVKLGNARVLATQRLARIDALTAEKATLEERLAASEDIRHEQAAQSDTVARGLRVDIARLEKELEKHAAKDPVLAGELLAGELSHVPDPEAPASTRADTVPITTATRRSSRRPRPGKR